ncbi:MAG: hypothetical protein WBH75_13235 [Thermoanaerobaculia bacterium]
MYQSGSWGERSGRRRLMDEYDNGEHYYPLKGQEIWAPPRFE